MFLEGIKVLDVGSYIAGPAAATVMSDFGADVIKVEPVDGDPFRRLLGEILTEYPNFAWDQDGRNKRSLAIDLTSPEGRSVLFKLVAQSDVFITNYRPNLLDQLELNYDDIAAIRPDIIYGQVNAYGRVGPDADRTGFDATSWWARSGLMDTVQSPGKGPAPPAAGMGDHPTAMSMFGGIMAALYRREKNGKGAHVHTSLLANGAWANSLMLQGVLVGYDRSDQRSPDDKKLLPLSTSYSTSDDRDLLFCILNPDKEWPKFVRAIERDDLATDPRFAEREQRILHAAELFDILEAVFASNTASHWCSRLDAEGITYSLAATLSEVANDEQMHANDILTPMTVGRQLYAHTINSPIWMTDEDKRTPVVAPNIGEHTEEILGEIGLSDSQINDLLTQGLAAQGDS